MNLRRIGFFWGGFALVVLLVDYALFWGAFGGWVNYDTQVQWDQVQSGVYSQWHPFAHTFLMMKLPSLIWNDYRVTVLWQVALCALTFGYAMAMLAKASMSRKWRIATGCVILLHPQFLFFMMSPLKDSAFAIAVLLVLAELVNVVISRGESLRCRGGCWRLAAGLALSMSFRHNGLFFVLPALVLLLVLFWRISGKGLGRLTVAFVVCLTSLKVLLPIGSEVRPASAYPRQYFFIESAGLPLSIMGAVYAKDPDRVPEDARRVLESIRPREVWTQFYELGSFNVVKHHGVAKLPEETIAGIWFPGWIQFFRLFGQTVAVDPKLAMKAALRTTSLVWNPCSADRKSIVFPLRKVGLGHEADFLSVWCVWMGTPVLGVCAIVLWLSLLTACRAVMRHRQGALLFCVSVVVYDLGTMLFLSGPNMQRFFWFNLFALMPLIWYNTQKLACCNGD